MTDYGRVWSRIDRSGGLDACWPWTGSLNQGYGRVRVGGRVRQAYRVAYETTVGPITPGVPLDHTCHDPATCRGGPTCPHRACCNPRHLAVSTTADNTGRGRSVAALPRGETCKHGHPLTEENVYRHGRGRHCRRCAIERAVEWNRRNRNRARP